MRRNGRKYGEREEIKEAALDLFIITRPGKLHGKKSNQPLILIQTLI